MIGLGDRIVVAAFEGWNDAGEAASSALSLIREQGSYEAVWQVDPDLYFDFQYTRPYSTTDENGRPILRWPEATLWRPASGTGLWLITGAEPARAWRAFAAEFVDVALREDVTGFVSLGSMMADVPHTRPITVFANSDNEQLQRELELEQSGYEGPGSILSVLHHAFEGVGIPSASLWASVPHYVGGQASSPKATLALLDRLNELTFAEVPRGDLAAQAAVWEATIDAAAAEDDDMRAYIRQLEQTRDTWEAEEASGDAIARAFERYLRRDNDGREGPRRA